MVVALSEKKIYLAGHSHISSKIAIVDHISEGYAEFFRKHKLEISLQYMPP